MIHNDIVQLTDDEVKLCKWAASYAKVNRVDFEITAKVEEAFDNISQDNSSVKICHVNLLASVFYAELSNFIYMLDVIYQGIPENGFANISSFYDFLREKNIIDENNEINFDTIKEEDKFTYLFVQMQLITQFNEAFMDALNSLLRISMSKSILHSKIASLFPNK